MKRLIIGNGKVSKLIRKDGDVVLSRPTIDIRDRSTIKNAIERYRPDVVINCAAMTNLEECQLEKSKSYETNTLGAANVLMECSDAGVKLVHISSGCLFDGNHEVSTEESVPTPRVWYTWTKTWADHFILNYGYENYLILRPRQLFSADPYKSNIITKFASMSRIGAIAEPNSATCIEDFGEMIDHLIEVNARGVFNCANEGLISPHEMASSIRDSIAPHLEVEEISYQDLLKRLPNTRVNTILSLDKLKSTGYRPRDVKEAFNDCLKRYPRT
jgi:dTDP-4-dehydrorhamnose reductase